MRRSTVILIVLFLLTIGVYSYLKNRPATAAETTPTVTLEPTTEVAYVFDAAEGVPTGFSIEAATGEVVSLERDAENAWAVKLPFEGAAEQSSAEAAASQLTTLRISDRVPTLKPEDVGLDQPAYILKVKFKDAVERIAEIGVLTPTETGYYVRIDKEIVIVNRSGIDALMALLTAPPYLETPTPSPIPPTETATPIPSFTPTAASTTEPTATP